MSRRRRFTSKQKLALERAFTINPRLTPETKYALSEILGLHEREVQVWFQNRRARDRSRDINPAGFNDVYSDDTMMSPTSSTPEIISAGDAHQQSLQSLQSQSLQVSNPSSSSTSPYGPVAITDSILSQDWGKNNIFPLSKFQICDDVCFNNFSSMEYQRDARNLVWVIYSDQQRIKVICPVDRIQSIRCFIKQSKECVLHFETSGEPTYQTEFDAGSNCWFPISDETVKGSNVPSKLVATGNSRFILPFMRIANDEMHLKNNIHVDVEGLQS